MSKREACGGIRFHIAFFSLQVAAFIPASTLTLPFNPAGGTIAFEDQQIFVQTVWFVCMLVTAIFGIYTVTVPPVPRW